MSQRLGSQSLRIPSADRDGHGVRLGLISRLTNGSALCLEQRNHQLSIVVDVAFKFL